MLYSPLVPARQYCRRDQRRGHDGVVYHDGVTSTIARLLPQEKKNTQRTQRLSRSHLTSACCSWRDAGRTAAAKQRKGGVFEAVPGAERPSLAACGSGGLIRRRYGLSTGAACPYTNHYYVFAACGESDFRVCHVCRVGASKQRSSSRHRAARGELCRALVRSDPASRAMRSSEDV